jgi:flavin reductase (DIM6/NTAB) family NADH-FMN oxidoreductase RutF
MGELSPDGLVTLDVAHPIWERFFMVAPLILVGSKDPDGGYNVAPKHMALPLGWEDYYGFVCAPSHHTYGNIATHRQFTVSFPQLRQVVVTALAASPRWDDDSKPGLEAVDTFPARVVDGVLVAGCRVYLECQLDRIVEPFGRASLIVGRVVAAYVRPEALRASDQDDNEILAQAPLIGYVTPGRFARIEETFSFPFPRGFAR